ncbi:DUF6359 domain-containing protein [Prevotella falsenii]|uniref:DUF6359 domain-containing protein n=1 Tax=Prevotella falsenii TaxID=515414 RepID=UPI00046962A8|nr:DUF6359 domain-containing protein [Prevotella falsenii]
MRIAYLSFLLIACFLFTSCTKNVYEYYGVTPETENEKKDDETDKNDDSEFEYDHDNKVQTVASFIATDFGDASVWVEGYIVGSCTKSIKNAVWEYPFSSDNAILLADEQGETDADKVISIQLKTKEHKETIGLATNPDNYNKRIRFLGVKKKYLGIWGMKNLIQAYVWVK